jgi:hypothetical protein
MFGLKMARRKKKRIVDKKWVSATFDTCPKCGSTPEILTYCKRDELFYHLDEVRCSAQCGNLGRFNIDSTGLTGLIEWDNDPFKSIM